MPLCSLLSIEIGRGRRRNDGGGGVHLKDQGNDYTKEFIHVDGPIRRKNFLQRGKGLRSGGVLAPWTRLSTTYEIGKKRGLLSITKGEPSFTLRKDFLEIWDYSFT